MADVTLGKKKNLARVGAIEELEVENGTDTVNVIFIDDYSKMGLKVTAANGDVTVYEVALTQRA